MSDCGHLLCELIGSSCSLAAKTIAPEVFEEVRVLLAAIDPDARDQRGRAAAVRLAEIIRREARDDRHLLAHARSDEPELVPALERLCARQR